MKKKDYRRDAKVLFIDTEVSPSLFWAYGQYETNAIKVEKAPILLAFSWKWLGEKGKAQGIIISDFKQLDNYDDFGIVKKLWDALDDAQIVVGHNANKFDCKMANSFFIRHNMTPPSPYKVVDTLQAARRFFKFDNNKLDYLGKLLSDGGKTEVTYGDCWDKMLHGSQKEKKKFGELMRNYCNNDVDVLEKIYLKLLPWINNHPNMALYSNQEHVCPRCGNESNFRVKAYRRTGQQITAIQYLCKECGAYVTRTISKDEKQDLQDGGVVVKSVFRNML